MNKDDYTTHNPWDTVWYTNGNYDAFVLHKSNKSQMIIKKGDWIKIPGRNDKVIIDDIIQSSGGLNSGPIGITYLPWRYDDCCFATKSFSIKGNNRLVICYPCGINHYGIHIDWDMFELVDPPDNINTEMVFNILV